MSQDMEPSLSEYARFYGLTTSHLDSNPLAGLAITHDLTERLEDDPELFTVDDAKDIDLNEKLFFGKQEALVLGCITETTQQDWDLDESSWLNPYRVRNMKMEIPMLKTNHEGDMRAFRCPIMPDLANEHLPLESLDDEADEGLTWPSSCQKLPDLYMRAAEKERLDVSIDELNYLQASLSLDSASELSLSFEGSGLEYARVSQTELLGKLH